MDPITQGTVGAAVPQSFAQPEKLRTAAWLGCLSGMAPDLDVLIRSPTDPMLFLEYHRQFTHALVFIPIGALICALVFHGFAKRHLNFGQIYLFCLLGYATHGLLDACTTYGTMLLWPFSDMRVAWNNVSVVAPLFTLPLLGFVIAAAIWRRPRLAHIGLLWAASYLAFGIVQRERAEAVGHEMARERGLDVVRLEAKPGFANLSLWKLVTETETDFHVDAVRLFAEPRFFPGDRAARLRIERDLPWLAPDSQQARDLARFDWFSNRYLALSEDRPGFIIDVRYSVVPNEIHPLWGIQLDPSAPPDAHVEYITDREGSAERVAEIRRMFIE